MEDERILFLASDDSTLITWLRGQGEQVIRVSDKITDQDILNRGYSFLISYGYRHILSKEVLNIFHGKAINLHISYLPWNRGADPNLWSFIEGTPKGVTIHYLDDGVDTGDIIVQKEIKFDHSKETLSTSYDKLQKAIQDLFMQNWQSIKLGKNKREKQAGKGSIHKIKDKDSLAYLLTDGWNTPVSVLEEYAAKRC